MSGPTRALLIEGLRQLDEWERHGPALPPLDAQVVLRVGSAELPSVVHPLTQEVLLLLEIYPRVRDVVDHCSHPDYQVLRTLQTLIERGMVQLRRGRGPRPPRSGLFTPAQARRLREWLTRGRGGPNGEAKLLVLSPDAAATYVFVKLLAGLPGMEVEEPFANRRFSADDLARIGRLAVERELGIAFHHVPADLAFAPVWSLASHGALGALLLLAAEGSRVLRPAAETLGGLPRARLFYVLLADGNEAELSDEVRANVSLLDHASLFVLPRESARDSTALLREAFARILP